MALPIEYMALLDDYVRDLTVARDDALRREEGRLKTWTQRLGSEARAREKLSRGPPACCGGRVIAVVRKYWLACDELNRKYGNKGIAPHEFMTELLEARTTELAGFLRRLPYWPIGKNEKGEWV
jgi:hypothetical protein